MRGACRVGRAAEKLQTAAREMAHVATVVEATSQPMARRDPLRARMDIIYKEVAPPGLMLVETALGMVAPDAECRSWKARWAGCCGMDHVLSLLAGVDAARMTPAASEHHDACPEGLAGELGTLPAGGGGESDQADSGCQGRKRAREPGRAHGC